MSNKEYWKSIEKVHLLAEKSKSATELVDIIHNHCGESQHGYDAFLPSSDDELYWTLYNAGWEMVSHDGFIHFNATAPDGSEIEYAEGDITILS